MLEMHPFRKLLPGVVRDERVLIQVEKIPVCDGRKSARPYYFRINRRTGIGRSRETKALRPTSDRVTSPLFDADTLSNRNGGIPRYITLVHENRLEHAEAHSCQVRGNAEQQGQRAHMQALSDKNDDRQAH